MGPPGSGLFMQQLLELCAGVNKLILAICTEIKHRTFSLHVPSPNTLPLLFLIELSLTLHIGNFSTWQTGFVKYYCTDISKNVSPQLLSALCLPMAQVLHFYLFFYLDTEISMWSFHKSWRHSFFPRKINHKAYSTGCLHGADFQPYLAIPFVSCLCILPLRVCLFGRD